MKQIKKYETNLLSRYITLSILIFFFLTNIFLNTIIKIFTYLSYLFLSFFTKVRIENSILVLEKFGNFIIIKECIAPSAYILITIIFFSLPIEYKKLFKIYLNSILVFTLFNLIRILFLMWTYVSFGSSFYENFHLIFYEFLSGVIVSLIIIFFLKKEKINKIYPIISDLKYLIKNIKLK